MKNYCPEIYNEYLVSKINQTDITRDIEILIEKEIKKIFNNPIEKIWEMCKYNFESFRYVKYYLYSLRYFLNIPKFESSIEEDNSDKLIKWTMSLNSSESKFFFKNYLETVPLFRDNFSKRVKDLTIKYWKRNVIHILNKEPTFENNISEYDSNIKNENLLDILLSEITRLDKQKLYEIYSDFMILKRLKYYKYTLELCINYYKENITELSTTLISLEQSTLKYENMITGKEIPTEFIYKKYQTQDFLKKKSFRRQRNVISG